MRGSYEKLRENYSKLFVVSGLMEQNTSQVTDPKNLFFQKCHWAESVTNGDKGVHIFLRLRHSGRLSICPVLNSTGHDEKDILKY